MTDDRHRRTITATADLTYVRANFLAIERVLEAFPAPCYYDESGTAYVPRDYLLQETDRERFERRATTEIERLGATYDAAWIADAWDAYRNGLYNICLQDGSPENIVRKNWLVDRIESLLHAPIPEQRSWVNELRKHVDELDALERHFCDFDRTYFGGSVSRDRCITSVRERFFSTEPQPHAPV